jgi:aspartate aminotransferase
MPTHHLATRVQSISNTTIPLRNYVIKYTERKNRPDINDFAVGNPQDMPMPEFVDALHKALTPQNSQWFGYERGAYAAREVVANSLKQSHRLTVHPDDVQLTTGNFAGNICTLLVLVEPGDEVIFMTPPWFYYEAMVIAAGGVPVKVRIRESDFDLDLDAIAAAITAKTRVIVINSPNNPTGKIYSADTLTKLADILTEASVRIGHPIYLISDEAYNRVLFDGRSFVSPVSYYPYSFLHYTYGKTLLTPGQRLGYIAVSDAMPARDELRRAYGTIQPTFGFQYPNTLMQHALKDLDTISIDSSVLQRRRDILVVALRAVGYEVNVPEGCFYLMPRSPISDDVKFIDILAEHDILALPGTVVELPGFFRLSLTASDEMVERSLSGFAKAREQALNTL